MADTDRTELDQVRAISEAAEKYIDGLPARLRLYAAMGGTTTIDLSAVGAIRLANRLERSTAQPLLVVIPPPTLPEQQIEALWRRLCGCLFLALAATAAADTFFNLLALAR